jgi:hypothetical protein
MSDMVNVGVAETKNQGACAEAMRSGTGCQIFCSKTLNKKRGYPDSSLQIGCLDSSGAMIRTSQKVRECKGSVQAGVGRLYTKQSGRTMNLRCPLTALRSSGLGIQTNPTKAAGLEQGGAMGTDWPAGFLLVSSDPQVRQCDAFG